MFASRTTPLVILLFITGTQGSLAQTTPIERLRTALAGCREADQQWRKGTGIENLPAFEQFYVRDGDSRSLGASFLSLEELSKKKSWNTVDKTVAIGFAAQFFGSAVDLTNNLPLLNGMSRSGNGDKEREFTRNLIRSGLVREIETAVNAVVTGVLFPRATQTNSAGPEMPSPNTEGATEVSRLRSDFQAEEQLLDSPLRELNSHYLGYLETQKSAFREAGDIKGLLAAESEIENFKGSPPDSFSSFGAIKHLQEIYKTQWAALLENRGKARVELIKTYIARSDGLSVELTKANRIEEAKLALAESQRFAFMEISSGGTPVLPSLPPIPSAKASPFINSLGMSFVSVPETKVLFCIHETRWRDYLAYAEENPGIDGSWHRQQDDGYRVTGQAGNHPVSRVNWADAKAFCTWLSEREGRTYRLPTDEEWSLAVGLGNKERRSQGDSPRSLGGKLRDEYPWGSVWPPPQGAGNFSDRSRMTGAPRDKGRYLEGYDDGYPTTAPVMSFVPNEFGLYDIGGNVWEWIEDWFDENQLLRFRRGGNWDDSSEGWLRSSARAAISPETRGGHTGFRIVIDLP